MLNKIFLLLTVYILFSPGANAQVPSTFVYQGQILQNGTTPLQSSTVTFNVKIVSPGVESCVLYEEQHFVNMAGSNGVFNLPIGNGMRSGTDSEDSSNLQTVFNNTTTINGITHCLSGSTYVPTATHTRKLRISYNDGSTTVNLSQDHHLQAAPYAWYANSLQGLTPSNFVQINPLNNVTQANLQNLMGGTNYTTMLSLIAGSSPLYIKTSTSAGAQLPSYPSNPGLPAPGSVWYDATAKQMKFYDGTGVRTVGGEGVGTGTVSSITAGSGLSGGEITTTGTIDIATGGVTSAHLADGGVANVDLASGIDAAKVTTGMLPLAVVPHDPTKLDLAGGTMTGALNMGGKQILATGHVTMSPLSTVTIGKYTAAEQVGLVAALAGVNAGAVWYNSDTGALMYWDGSAAQTISNLATAGGDITEVIAGSGMTGGGITGAVTVGVATGGITSTHILDGTVATVDLADGSVTDAKIDTMTASKLTGIVPNLNLPIGTATAQLSTNDAIPHCAPNQKLEMSNGPVYTWTCVTDIDSGGDITEVTTAAPLAGGGTSGALALTINYDNTTIGLNGSSALEVKDDGVTTTKILDGAVTDAKVATVSVDKIVSGSGKYFTYMPAGTECGNDEILKWDATNDRWMCGTDISLITSVFGRTGVVVATAGDYTATQITNTPAGDVAAITAQAAINELDTEKVSKAGDTVTGALVVQGALSTGTELRLSDSDASNYVALKSPAVVGTNVIFTLPGDAGTSGQVLTTDGAGVLTWSSGNIGDITSVVAGSGLTGGGTTGDVTVSIDTGGVTTTHILDGTVATADLADSSVATAKIADDAVTTAKIVDGAVTDAKVVGVSVDKITSGATKYFSYMPAGTECGNDEVLKWDATNDRWMCGTDINLITSVFGRTGVVVATAGDYTATQITNTPAGDVAAITAQAAINELDTEKVSRAGDTITGALEVQGALSTDSDLTIKAQKHLRLSDSDSSNYVALQSPATVGANVVFTLPGADGTTGQVLTTDGSGVLTWTSGNTGDITSVVAGSGMTGGGTAGDVTVGIDTGGVTSTHILDGTIAAADLASDSVTTAKIVDGAVTNDKITSMDVAKVTSATGSYFLYKPNDVACTAGEVLKWNNSRWECAADNDTGDITDVVAGTGLTGGAATGSATLNVDIGTGPAQLATNNAVPHCTANQKLEMSSGPVYSWTCVTDTALAYDNSSIGMNGSSELEVKNDGITTAKILDANVTDAKIASLSIDKLTSGAGKYFTYMPAGTECANNEILKWDATNDRWMCAADEDTNLLTSVFGRTGVVVATAGDYTATQITNTPAGDVAAITAQAAINELDTEKVSRAGDTITGALVVQGGLTSEEHLVIKDQKQVRYSDSDSSNYVALQSPAAVGANVVFTLPGADGTTGQVLTTDGSGVLTWTSGNTGDITSVVAGSGMTGGGTAGDVTVGIDTGGVTTTHILDGTIATADLADSSVATVKIADDAVTTAKIVDGAVTDAKVAAVSVDKITSGATKYFTYMPAGTECGNDEVLKWDATNDRWMCGTDINLLISVFGRTGVVVATAGDYTATQITNTPAGDVAAVTAQAAINELDTEKVNRSGDTITGALVVQGGLTSEDHLVVKDQKHLRLSDGDSSNYVALQAPSAVSTNVVLTFPGDAGTTGQVLTTDGSGVLSWTSGNTGDITSVVAGSGMTGGGTSGDVTVGIDTGGVTSTHILDGTIATADLADSSVATAKIADDAVTTVKIANGAVTDAKITSMDVAKITSSTGNYFLYKPNDVACAAGEILKWNNSRWECAADNDTGDITDVVAGTGMTGGSASGSATLNVDIGTGPAQLATNNAVPHCLGSQKLEMSNGPVYAWSCVSDLDSGDITEVNTSAPLTGGQTSGAITLAISYDDTSIGMNGSSALEVKDDGITTAKIANGAVTDAKIATLSVDKLTSGASKYFTYMPAGTECGNDETLKWDATNDRWMCGTDINLLTSVFGRTGVVVATAGDYTATQITNTPAGDVAAVTAQAAINELDTEKVSRAGDTITGALTVQGDINAEANLVVKDQKQLRLSESGSSNYVALQAPASVGSNVVLTFPGDAGTSGQVLTTDGSGVLSWTSGNTGDITSVVAGTGLTGGGTSGDVTVSIDTGGVTSTHILDGTVATADLADDSVTTVKIADGAVTDSKIATLSVDKLTSGASKYFTYMPAGTECGNDEILKWDATNDRWICGADVDTNLLTSVFGRTGVVVATAGDYSASQITNTPAGSVAAVTAQAAIDELDSEKVSKAGDTVTGALAVQGALSTDSDLTINDQKQLRLSESGSANYVGLRAPASVSAIVVFTLPGVDGTTGQVLTTDGSGVLSWTSGNTGDVTGVIAGSGMTGGGTSGDVTVGIDTGGVTTTHILDGTIATADLADGSVTNSKITSMTVDKITNAASSYFTYQPNNTACNVGEVLKWTNSRWECGVDNDTGDITDVVAGTGMTGGAASGSATLNVDIGTGPAQLATNDAVPHCLGSQKLEMSSGPVYAWSCVSDLDSGDITAVNTTAPLTGGATSGAITLAISYDDSSIGLNGSSALEVKDDGITTAKIANSAVTDAKIASLSIDKLTSGASKYFSYMPAGTECGNDEILKWDATNDRWICGADDNTNLLTSVFGRTGVVVATAGDYTATQITNTPAGNIAAVTAQAAIDELDSEKVSKAGDTITGALTVQGDINAEANLVVKDQKQLRLSESGSSNYVALQAPASVSSNVVLTFPGDAGTSGQVLTTDGSGVLSWTSGNTGDITSVVAGSGMTGGGTTGDVTVGIDTGGVTSTHILDGTIATADLADDSVTTVKIADGSVTDAKIATLSIDKLTSGASKYFSYMPAGTECVNNEILKWDASNDRWICGTDDNTNLLTSVFGRTGVVVATAGDYSATQITNTPAGDIAAVTAQAAIDELDSEKVSKAGDTVSGALVVQGALSTDSDLTINDQKQLRLSESGSSNYVGIRAPASVSSNVVLTLPGDAGTSGQVLTTDGSGVLSWTSGNTGDITSVVAGSGMTGGGTTGDVTVGIDTGGVTTTHILDGTIATADIADGAITDAKITSMTVDKITSAASAYFTYQPNNTACTAGQVLKWNNARWECGVDNDTGDITDVVAGTGMTGGSASGSATLNVDIGTGPAQLSTNDAVPHCLGSQKLQMSSGPVYAWSCVSDLDSGDITEVTTTAPLTGGATSGAIALAISYDDSSIGLNGSSALEVKDDGISTAKIANSAVTDAKIASLSIDKLTSGASKYFSYMPAGTECGNDEILKWDATNDRWICGTDDNTNLLTSVFGRTGVVVATAGDYTATQITNTPAGDVAAVTAQAAINELDTEKVSRAGDTITGALTVQGDINAEANIALKDQKQLRLFESGSSNYVALQAPASVSSNIVFTLPGADGTSGQVLTTDGAGILSWTSGNSGDITSVVAGTGLTGGGTSGDVTVSIDAGGVTSTHILDGTIATADLADDSVTTAKIVDASVTDAKIATLSIDKLTSGASKYFTYMPAGTECGNDETLKWDATNDRWMCGTDINLLTSVFGRTGVVVATAGDYTATQITNTPAGDIAAVTAQAAINELDSEKVSKAGDTVTGALVVQGALSTDSDLTINDQKQLRLSESGSTNYVGLRAPASVSSNIVFTLPGADGTSGQVLTTDGSGALSWSSGNSGDITGVVAGSGMTGGGTSGDVTVSVDAGGITATHLAADAVISAKILDGTIATADIADGAITNSKITSLTVDKITSAASTYFTYQPNNTACNVGEVLKWNNSRWECGVDLDSGDITAVVAGTGMTGGATTGSATINVDIGTGPAQLATNDAVPHCMGSQKLEMSTGPVYAWSCVNDVDAGGDITEVTTSAPLSGGNTSGAIALTLNYDNTSIGLAGSNLEVKDSGITTAKINDGAVTNVKIASMTVDKITSAATKYFSYMPAGTECANNETLKWDATNDHWICGADTDTNLLTSVFGRTGVVVATAGDYTAAQVTNTAAGNIAAVTAQAAINELDTEKASKAGDTFSGAVTVNANVTIGDQNSLHLADSDSSNYIALRAPATVATNVTLTLPDTAGTTGQVLTTNGSGVLSWSSVTTGDITSVVAGSGLTGGATSGDATVSIDTGGVTSTHILDGTIATADLANLAVTDAKITSMNVSKITSGAGNYLTYLPNNVACTTGQVLKWNNSATRWECGADNDTGDITGVTAGTGLIGGGTSGTPTLEVDLGTGASQLFTNDDVPHCLSTQKLEMSAGPIYSWGCVTDVNSGGDITAVTTTAPLSGGATSGAIALTLNYDNSTIGLNGSNQIEVKDDGITLDKIAASSVNSSKIVDGSIASSDLADSSVTSNKILDGTISTADIANTAVTDAKIASLDISKLINGAGSYFTYQPNNTACTAGQVLKWSSVNTRWECGADNDSGDITSVTAGSGLTGGGTVGALTLAVDVGSGGTQFTNNGSVPNCGAFEKLQMSAGPFYTYSCVADVNAHNLIDNDADTKITVEASADEDTIRFTTANTERMAIGNTGLVGIGTAPGADRLTVLGDIRVGTTLFNGCIKNFAGGTVTGTCSSDVRLKQNIKPLGPISERLAQIAPKHFDWRAKEFPERKYGEGQDLGLIAQDVLKFIPDLVEVDEDGLYRVRYHHIPFYLLQGFGEQHREISSLNKKVNALEKENQDLKKRLDAIEKMLRMKQ